MVDNKERHVDLKHAPKFGRLAYHALNKSTRKFMNG